MSTRLHKTTVAADQDAATALRFLRSGGNADRFLSAAMVRGDRVAVGNGTVIVELTLTSASHRDALREVLNDTSFRWCLFDAPTVTRELARHGVFTSVHEAWTRGTSDGDRDALLDVRLTARLLFGKPEDADDDTLTTLATRWTGTCAADAHPAPVQDTTLHAAACTIADTIAVAAVLEPMARHAWSDVLVREHRAARIVTSMCARGMALSIAAMADAKTAHTQRLSDATAALKQHGVLFAKSEPRPDSIAAQLRAEGAEPETFRGRDGQLRAALDGDAMRRYARSGSRLAELVLEWRDAATVTGFLEQIDHAARAGRVFANIDTLGASSGRMTCSAPNMQALPSALRRIFTAGDDHVFVSADFSSVEMRCAAAVTGDATLRRLYQTPLTADASEQQRRACCPYWTLAWRVYGPDATVADRARAKVVVLADMYSSGVELTAKQADITVDEARLLRDAWHAEVATMKHWWRDVMTPQLDAGLTTWTLPSGRQQRLTDVTKAWQGFSRLIQGVARDLLVDALFRLEDADLLRYALLPIHDEVLFTVPREGAEDITARIQACMESTFRGIPIRAEAQVLGASWCEKS